MKAGLQVAEGSYGCFYQPRIPCDGKTRPETGGSKIMFDKEEVLKELQSSKAVLEWDPKLLQSSVPQSQCEVAKDEVLKQETLDKCTVDGISTSPKVYLLQTDDRSDPKEYVDLSRLRGPFILGAQAQAKGLANLFRGLQMQHSHNFFHNDVHASNAIISSKTGLMKWIDFGLSLQVKNWPEFPKDEQKIIENLQKYQTSRRVPFGLATFYQWILHRETIRKFKTIQEFVSWNSGWIQKFKFSAWKGTQLEDFDFSTEMWTFWLGRNAFFFWKALQMKEDSKLVQAFRQQDLAGAFTMVADLADRSALDGASLKLKTTIDQIVSQMQNYLTARNAMTDGLKNLPWTLWAEMLEK